MGGQEKKGGGAAVDLAAITHIMAWRVLLLLQLPLFFSQADEPSVLIGGALNLERAVEDEKPVLTKSVLEALKTEVEGMNHDNQQRMEDLNKRTAEVEKKEQSICDKIKTNKFCQEEILPEVEKNIFIDKTVKGIFKSCFGLDKCSLFIDEGDLNNP